MQKVTIVTDSVADLPLDVAQTLNIKIVPLMVRFGTEVYRDGIDITADQFYKRLRNSPILPTTSTPLGASFASIYDSLAGKTEDIIVVTLTSKLSATYEVAVQSIGLMKNKCRVEVVDSQHAIMAQGFIVIEAAQAAYNGASKEIVLDVIQNTISQVGLCAAFDTLEYLKRGGRIGKAQAFLGSLLKVNPIIGMKDGEVFPHAKKRSRAQALDYLCDYAASYEKVNGLAVEYAVDYQEAKKLFQRLQSRFPGIPVYLTRASPVIGTHTGPGLIAVSVFGKK